MTAGSYIVIVYVVIMEKPHVLSFVVQELTDKEYSNYHIYSHINHRFW